MKSISRIVNIVNRNEQFQARLIVLLPNVHELHAWLKANSGCWNSHCLLHPLQIAIRSGYDESAILLARHTNLHLKLNNKTPIEEACIVRNHTLLRKFFELAELRTIPTYLWPVIAMNDDVCLLEFIESFTTRSHSRFHETYCQFCGVFYSENILQIAANHNAFEIFCLLFYRFNDNTVVFPHDEKMLSFLLAHGHTFQSMMKVALASHNSDASILLLASTSSYRRKDYKSLTDSTIDSMVYETNRSSLFSRIQFSQLKPQTPATKFMRSLALGKVSKFPPCSILRVLVQTTFRFLIRFLPDPIQDLVIEYNKLITLAQLQISPTDWFL
jgi:hypothetical protein